MMQCNLLFWPVNESGSDDIYVIGLPDFLCHREPGAVRRRCRCSGRRVGRLPAEGHLILLGYINICHSLFYYLRYRCRYYGECLSALRVCVGLSTGDNMGHISICKSGIYTSYFTKNISKTRFFTCITKNRSCITLKT